MAGDAPQDLPALEEGESGDGVGRVCGSVGTRAAPLADTGRPMHIEPKFHSVTGTITYIVFDEDSKDAVIIDPVLDYDPLASQTQVASVLDILDFVRRHELRVHLVLETHAHADHISGAQAIKAALGAKIAIGEHIREVQETFKTIFDLDGSFATDGRQFDRLVVDGETLRAGGLNIEILHTPGHTPACVSYRIGDAVFTGDALFVPDQGTGRCDFPKGDAQAMYDSVTRKLYTLPDETRVFVGHDYQPGGRAVAFETTIGASKAHNVQLPGSASKAEFVAFRQERDAGLAPPRLLFPSVQLNIAAGRLPEPRANGIRYLSTPLNLFGPTDDTGAAKKR